MGTVRGPPPSGSPRQLGERERWGDSSPLPLASLAETNGRQSLFWFSRATQPRCEEGSMNALQCWLLWLFPSVGLWEKDVSQNGSLAMEILPCLCLTFSFF